MPIMSLSLCINLTFQAVKFGWINDFRDLIIHGMDLGMTLHSQVSSI